MINSFDKENFFLSNFYLSTIIVHGVVYPTVEHAFQAAKTLDHEDRQKIAELGSPGEAKRAGRRVKLRSDWEAVKEHVMYEAVKKKFSLQSLRDKLFDTKNQNLIEGNTWGDTFWGMVDGVGENHLGRILMRVRRELSEELLYEIFGKNNNG